MTKNWINDNTPWKNEFFLDLPFWREIFTDPKTSQRADTYHTRKNTEQANRLLEAIKNKDSWVDIGSLAQALQRPQEEIQHLINDMVWNQKNTEHIIAHTGQQTQEWLDTISSQLAAWALEIKSTLEQLLGYEVPKNIPLHILGKTLTAEWKQSLIALAAKWAVNPEKLSKVISPQFAQYMKEGISSTQARRMQESILLTLQALKNGTSAAHRKYHQFLHDADPSMKMINQDRAQKQQKYIQEQTEKYENIARQLVSEDELALLDVAHYAKDKSIGDMLAENIISPALASRFAKNGVLDGRFAKMMTNMFDVKDGRYRPLVEMDGIAGIWQWTKANALMQRTLVDQWMLSLNKQDRFLMKQDVSNRFLDNIDRTIALWTQEFHVMRIQTHDDLRQIDRSITSGFGVANTHLGNMDKNIKTGFNTANTYLQNMDTNIFHGFQGTHNLLSNIHEELASRHQEMGVSNQYLAYAGEMLDSIDTGISFANEQLGDIAYYTQATTELLHETNQLIAHSNQLQIITNHQLGNIQQQIVYSRAHLTHVLQAMTGALVGELQDIKHILATSWQLHYIQTQQNTQVIQELQQQSVSLKNMDQKLLRPNEIKANEFYQAGSTRLKSNQYPDAITDFEQAIQSQSTHVQAQYALAIAYYHSGNMVKAQSHFQKSATLATQGQDFALLSQVYLRLAKIALKKLTIQDANALLEEAIACDPKNIDAQVLKIQIEQLQKEYSKVKISAHVLFEQLFAKDKDIVRYGIIDIDLKSFNKKIKKIIEQAIASYDTKRLLHILQRLQLCHYVPYQEQILLWILERNPSLLIQNHVVIQDWALSYAAAKKFVDTFLRKEHQHSEKYYYIAYILRALLPNDTIATILKKWLAHDTLWTQYQTSRSPEEKQRLKKQILQKWYDLWPEAAGFIRDFLTRNPLFDA